MSLSDWRADKPLIIDTNTTLSALIGGTARELILELDRELWYPEPAYIEIQRNRGIIQERSGLPATKIENLIDILFNHIELVPEENVVVNYDTAYNTTTPLGDADPNKLFGDRDEDDVVFLAAALAKNGDIWSEDGVFTHQNHACWFRTKDVIEFSNLSAEL